jgi:hypothetical protein
MARADAHVFVSAGRDEREPRAELVDVAGFTVEREPAEDVVLYDAARIRAVEVGPPRAPVSCRQVPSCKEVRLGVRVARGGQPLLRSPADEAAIPAQTRAPQTTATSES